MGLLHYSKGGEKKFQRGLTPFSSTIHVHVFHPFSHSFSLTELLLLRVFPQRQAADCCHERTELLFVIITAASVHGFPLH